MSEPVESSAADHQASEAAECALADVLITHELERRPARAPNPEAENRAFADLAQALADDPRGVLQKTVELARELFNADSIGVSVLEPSADGEVFRWHAISGAYAENQMATMPRDASPCGDVLREGQVLLFSHPARYFTAAREAKPWIHELLLAPWCVKGEVTGTFWAMAHTAERKFDKEDARLLRSFARFAAAAWQTSLAMEAAEERQKALRQSEEKLRSLFDSIDEGLAISEMIHDDRGEIIDMIYRQVNAAFERHGGIQDAVGRSIYEMLPGVEAYWLDHYKQVARTGQPIRVENHQQDVDRWFEVYFARVDTDGRYVATVFKDISDRKQAERALSEREERQGYLLKLSDILQRLEAPNEIKTAAMHMLGEHLSVSRTQYHEVNSSGEFYGADGIGYANGLPLLDFKYRIDQFGSFVAEDFKAGRPFRSDDLLADPRPTAEERKAYGLYQIRAGAGIPLLRGGKLVAILAVHDMRPHAWTDLEMELIRETAERVWVAVEKVRTERAVRESAERQAFLLTFSDALRAEPSADAVADRAIQLLSEQLRLDRCYLAEYRMEEDRADITHQAGNSRLAPMPETIRLSDFPEAFRVVFDRTLVIDDVLADQSLSDTDRDNIISLGIRALLAPTLRKGPHRPLWVMVAVSVDPRRWTEDEVALVEEVAERTWVAVERARAEAARRDGEERLRLALDAGGLGFFRWHASTDRAEPDARMRAMLGVSSDEELNLSAALGNVIHPEDAHHYADAVTRALDPSGDGRFREDFRTIRPSGDVRWITITGQVRFESDPPRAEWMHGVAMDITDRKRAEEALRASEERLRNALAISTVGVMFWEDERLVDMNDAFLQMTGFTREEALGKTWQELTPLEFHDASTAFLQAMEATGEGPPYEKQYFCKNGSRWWGLFAGRKLEDGFVEFVLDISERRRAEAALRESEKRLRQFGENSSDVLWVRDAERGVMEYLSPAFESLFGASADVMMRDPGRVWRALVHPDHLAEASEAMPRLVAGEPLTLEYRIVRPSDGQVRWIRDTGFPMPDETGRVRRVGGIAQDVTRRRRTEEALRESEERFRELGEASSDVIWVRDAQSLRMEYVSPAFESIYGAARDSILGAPVGEWLTLIHGEDRATVERVIDRVRRGERVQHEFRIVRPSDGQVRWIENTDFPLLDSEGLPKRIGGIAKDVTEQKRAAERQRLLLHELQHRVRNVLALVSSVVNRTGDGASDVEEYRAHLSGRLNALARTQALLTRRTGAGVSLESLIREELLAQVADEDALDIRGPDVELAPKAAEVLTLAVHELATNALKYGALAEPDGRLEVLWRIVPDGAQPWLEFQWRERGVRLAAVAPRRQGFGTQLITRRVPYELRGRGALEFEPGGVHASIAFPLRPGESILQTDGGGTAGEA